MARTKHHRDKKQQLGQFLTPREIAVRVLKGHTLRPCDRVLEPGFGAGAFLLPLIDTFMMLRSNDLSAVLNENIWGIEVDDELFEGTLAQIARRWGPLPEHHNLVRGDFLLQDYPNGEWRELNGAGRLGQDGWFDLIVGNPPFGGTVSIEHQNRLEAAYGRRGGLKIKKETYSFFIVKSLDLLRTGGRLEFICSDTFLTIPTMKGLRKALMDEGTSEVIRLDEFSPETSYPMVVLRFAKDGPSDSVKVEHRTASRASINATANLSWRAGGALDPYFMGPTLGEVMVASSGMTTGKNEYFVRDIVNGELQEPYAFTFVEDPVSVERELARARLNQLSKKQLAKFAQMEQNGATRRNVRVTPREEPLRVALPHPDYRYYNKAQTGLFYAPPRYAIYWRDKGDAVLTFKQNGRWYLHGVGGGPFFEREGITWSLVASRLKMRYLPEGYILDSGSPCAFLRDGVPRDELWFILGWTLTEKATEILKNVLNHTMNIQSKDFERMPYPFWVSEGRRHDAIALVRETVTAAMNGLLDNREDQILADLECLYMLDTSAVGKARATCGAAGK